MRQVTGVVQAVPFAFAYLMSFLYILVRHCNYSSILYHLRVI